MYRPLQLASLVLITLTISFTPPQDFEWKSDVEKMLSEFLSCGGPTPPNTPCNTFLSQALKRVYNINDFDRAGGGFLTANEMADYVKIHTDKWTELGDASSQQALKEAQGYANIRKAVIAIQQNPDGHGHVVLIVPGILQKSGSWNLDCPNSASFFLNQPAKSYVSRHLGFAFAKPTGVKIYGRNF